MPGSPPLSPRFGAPRYSDADAASFSAQVNGVTDVFDAQAAKLPSAWTDLTLMTSIGQGSPFNASARLFGNRLELAGAMTNNTGSSMGIGSHWATLPSGMWVPGYSMSVLAVVDGAPGMINIGTNGWITVSTAVATGHSVSLFGASAAPVPS